MVHKGEALHHELFQKAIIEDQKEWEGLCAELGFLDEENPVAMLKHDLIKLIDEKIYALRGQLEWLHSVCQGGSMAEMQVASQA